MADRRAFLTLSLLSFIVTCPLWYLLASGWPKKADHILRATILNQVSQQFWSGDWYPRWLQGANSGLGSPAFVFQPPLNSLEGVFLEWLKPIDPHGFGRLTIVTTLTLSIGGYACYLWLLEYFDRRRSLYGAMIYITFPTTMRYLLVCFNIPAATGAMVFPLILLNATRLSRDPLRMRYSAGYAITQAMLIFAHLPSALMFTAIPWCYAICSAEKEKRIVVSVVVSLSTVLGVALSAMYWVPVLVNKRFILFSDFIGLYRPSLLHWKLSPFSIDRAFLTFSAFAILGPLLLCCWDVRNRRPFAEHTRELIFWFAVIGFTIFMMSAASRVIWSGLPILHNLQFPYRFQEIALPAIAFIIANWLPKLRIAVVYFLVSIVAIAVMFDYAARRSYSPRLSYRCEAILNAQLIPRNAHMTIWMRRAGIHQALRPPKRFVDAPLYQVIVGEADVTNVEQGPRSLSFHVHATSRGATVALKRYFYPGWIVDETPMQQVKVGEYDALLAVELPSGDYDVKLRQPWLPGEEIGDFISLCALGWLISAPVLISRLRKLQRLDRRIFVV